MNHPTNEEWMDYLYRELPDAHRQRLEAHLSACAVCHETVARWRSAVRSLSTWQLTNATPANSAPSLALKWAVAAVLVFGFGLCAGIVLARAHRPLQTTALMAKPASSRLDNLDTLRAEFSRELAQMREQLLESARQENLRLLANLAGQVQAARQEDRQVLQAICQELEQKMETQVSWLRHDLETVAIKASDQLYWTRQKLGQLALAKSDAPAAPPNRGSVE
jgi:hypothetical protein